MDLIHEKVFVNRYHYDVRNHEWEKENGVPKTNVEVTFQLHNKDEEANNTSVVAVLQFMIVRDEFVISGIVSQMDHIQNRIVNEPKDFSQEEAEAFEALAKAGYTIKFALLPDVSIGTWDDFKDKFGF